MFPWKMVVRLVPSLVGIVRQMQEFAGAADKSDLGAKISGLEADVSGISRTIRYLAGGIILALVLSVAALVISIIALARYY